MEIIQVDTCIICLGPEGFSYKGSCECRPIIHALCLNTWYLANGNTCPICRKIYKITETYTRPNTCQALCACTILMTFVAVMILTSAKII